MKKYAVVVDYKAGCGKGSIEFKLLEAKTVIEAMKEAEKFFTDETYLLCIAEKFGKVEKEEFGKVTSYRDVLESRTEGQWTPVENNFKYQLLEGKGWSDWECKCVR